MLTHHILVGCLLICSVSSQDRFSPPSGMTPLDMLMKAVPGTPGEDYPIYAEVPDTSFSCEGKVEGGYYVDVEANCQPFHVCTRGGHHPKGGRLVAYSFLCPNGSLFNQQYFICDWWFNVDCLESESLYYLNDELFQESSSSSELASLNNEISSSLSSGSKAPRSGFQSGFESPPRFKERGDPQESSRSRDGLSSLNDVGFQDTSFSNTFSTAQLGTPRGTGRFSSQNQFGGGLSGTNTFRREPNLNRISVKEFQSRQNANPSKERDFSNQISSKKQTKTKFSQSKKSGFIKKSKSEIHRSFENQKKKTSAGIFQQDTNKQKGFFQTSNQQSKQSNFAGHSSNKNQFGQNKNTFAPSPASDKGFSREFESTHSDQAGSQFKSTQRGSSSQFGHSNSKGSFFEEREFSKQNSFNNGFSTGLNKNGFSKSTTKSGSESHSSFGQSFKTPGATVQLPVSTFNEFNSRENEDTSEVEFLNSQSYPSFTTTTVPSTNPTNNFQSNTGRFSFSTNKNKEQLRTNFFTNTVSSTSVTKQPTIIKLNATPKITFVQIKKVNPSKGSDNSNSEKVSSRNKNGSFKIFSKLTDGSKINEIASFSRGNTKTSLKSSNGFESKSSATKNSKTTTNTFFQNGDESSSSLEKDGTKGQTQSTVSSGKSITFGTGIRTFASGQKPRYSTKSTISQSTTGFPETSPQTSAHSSESSISQKESVDKSTLTHLSLSAFQTPFPPKTEFNSNSRLSKTTTSSSKVFAHRSPEESQRFRDELIPPTKSSPLISKFADPTFEPIFEEKNEEIQVPSTLYGVPLAEPLVIQPSKKETESIEVPSLTYGVPLAEPIQIPSLTYGVPLAEPLSSSIQVPSETYGLPSAEPVGISSQVLVNEPPPPPPPIL